MKTILQYFAAFILMLGIILQSYAVNARPLADRPAPEFDYVQEVGEGKFLFVMLSIEDDPTGYGQGGSVRVEDIRRQYPQSGLYRHDGSVNPIWTVDWYAFQVALSSDGQYLVRWGPWPFHENYNELAVAFYKNGREIKQYTVRDLVAEPELLPQSVSHYEWEKEMSFDATTNVLHLETHNGEKYDFDVTTGKNLVDKESSPTNVALIAVIGILLFCGAFVLLRKIRDRSRISSNPTAEQSVHLTCGSLRDLGAFFWLRAASRPAPKQNPRPPTRR